MHTPHRLTRVLGAGLFSSALATAAVVGTTAAQASAAPTNASNAISGTFSCGDGPAGTFVVNSGGGNGQGTTWNVAHLSFDLGGSGVFHPTGFNLMFSFDGQPFPPEIAQKPNPDKGALLCTISASNDGASLTGTVTGFITTTG